MIANKQTVLDKIKVEKALDTEILDLVKNDEIEGEIEKATDFELFCNGELFKVNHFVKELEEKKKTRSLGYLPESPIVQPHVSRSPEKVVRLPKLAIKPFRGGGGVESTSWITFLDSFRSAIDSSTKLSPVEKMNYLFGYLEGVALKTVSGLKLCNENYDKAWELLEERYGNKEILIAAHTTRLHY